MELMGEASWLVSTTFRPTEVYLAAGLYYLGLVTAAAWMLHRLEVHYTIPGFERSKQ
jgi:polar amino acid transport system permease protein